MAFTDELASGVVPAGSPELAASFGLTASQAAGWTLVAFQILGVVLEPPLLALAKGRRARTLRILGLWLMAASVLGAALAPSYGVLLAALVLYGPASGLGTNLAQSALALAHPDRVESVLARWSLLGSVGDLVAPAVLAASVALGAGWRGALLGVGAMAILQAIAATRGPAEGPGGGGSSEAAASLRGALRSAIASPALLGWSLATVLCGAFMDELLVSFGALWLAGRLQADASHRAVVLSAWVLGGMIGSALLARVAGRFRSSTLLAVSGAGCALAYLAWLASRGWLASALTFGAAGLFAAWHYPLVRARAFATMPDQPHLVLAVGSACTVVDLALPAVVGLIADRAGLLPALLVLLLQPLGALVAAVAARRGGG